MTSGEEVTTIVTNVRVKAGRDDDFAAWQQRMNRIVANREGYVSHEVIQPVPPVQEDWVIIQRFQTPESLKKWLSSPERTDMLAEIEPALDSSDQLSVFVGNDAPTTTDAPTTAVIATRVRPGSEEDFKRWQMEVDKVQSQFPGYQGCNLQPPVEGLSTDWVTLLRFDSQAHLNDWLESDQRQHLIAEADQYIDQTQTREIQTSFAGWFRFGPNGRIPTNVEQASIVLLALFPVVMLELMFFPNPFLAWMNMSPATFIANVVSVAVLTWGSIPLANKVMGWWLNRPSDAPRSVFWKGIAALIVMYSILVVFFIWLHSVVTVTPITTL